jgi:hypothetical protein
MASQQRITKPIETIAPTGVPGTVKPPYRPIKLYLRTGMTSPTHQPKDQADQRTKESRANQEPPRLGNADPPHHQETNGNNTASEPAINN